MMNGIDYILLLVIFFLKVMARIDIFSMKFSKIYFALLNKCERKNKSKYELDNIIEWLFDYSTDDLNELVSKDEISFGEFIENAPKINPSYVCIKGNICGIRVEEIEDEMTRIMRCLDKLVDDLVKKKSFRIEDYNVRNS